MYPAVVDAHPLVSEIGRQRVCGAMPQGFRIPRWSTNILLDVPTRRAHKGRLQNHNLDRPSQLWPEHEFETGESPIRASSFNPLPSIHNPLPSSVYPRPFIPSTFNPKMAQMSSQCLPVVTFHTTSWLSLVPQMTRSASSHCERQGPGLRVESAEV